MTNTVERYDKAIEHFDKSIKLNPRLPQVYLNRGILYARKREHDRAIEDFNKAIELDRDYAVAYFNRGLAWLMVKESRNAESDLSHAQRLGLNIVSVFSSQFGAVVDFERKHSVQLPENIKAMLTPQQ